MSDKRVSEMTDAEVREMAGASPGNATGLAEDLRWVLPGLESAAEFMPPKTRAAYERLRAIAGMSAPRTVHYHWPPQCGLMAVPEGDTWSGNFDLVTCSACLVHTVTTTGIRDEAEEFGFGRNAAPPWEQSTS